MANAVQFLKKVCSTKDPQKKLFVVSYGSDKIKRGLACSAVTKTSRNSGKFYLVTCREVASSEDMETNGGRDLNVDRFSTSHFNSHRIRIDDIRDDNDDKFSFILHSTRPEASFPLYEVNGPFKRSCYSYVISNGKTKRVDWIYGDSTKGSHTTAEDSPLLEKNVIALGSPLLWTDPQDITFVVGVIGLKDDALSPMFFRENSHKIPDLPKAVELFPLPMEVLPSITQITLRWNRVEDAQNYRVYQQIENQDSEWIRVRTTTDDRCTTKVEKGNVYRFKVTGGNVHGEGKERNIRIVKVLDVPMPVKLSDFPSEIHENRLTLKWNEADDNGTPITHYTVYQSVLTESGPVTECIFKTITANSFEIIELEGGKTYEFQVTASNKCGEGFKEQHGIKRVTVVEDQSEELSFLELLIKLFYYWWNGSTG